MSDLLLEVDELAVKYGRVPAVNWASFKLHRNRVLGIVGESGSGKSTLIWALTRLLPEMATISSGAVYFEGQDLLRLRSDQLRALRGTRISYISQDPMSALTPALTIGQQMMDVLYREPWSQKEKWSRAIDALEWVSLPDPAARMKMYPYELSGGQRQRVSIAMALMLEPDLVIADEPTTALDATLEVEILELLQRLQHETESAVIFVTHHLGVVSSLCDDVLVMKRGDIVESGPVSQVFSNPTHEYTRMLLRCDPARIDQPTRRLPTMTDDLNQPISIVSGPADRVKVERPPVLDIDGLRVNFTKHSALPEWLGGHPQEILAVQDVSLDVREGETLALVGESGSGKTTIARSVLGLVCPTAGSVTVAGLRVAKNDVQGLKSVRACTSMMFQDPVGSLSPRVTVGEQILEPLFVQGHQVVDGQKTVAELLTKAGLDASFATRYPHQLSGGQARRVGVARALALDPKLIIADEPTAGLDVSVQGEVLNLLNEIQERTGVSILIITHNMSVVRHCADRVVVLLKGQIVETGPCAQVFEAPSHDYTRALIVASRHELPEQAVPG
ncbi:Glutathione import ATP-binding protein GsiA [Roseovarius albus]|uniref:Glutathione import ATP-binding protein GsiA n=1 Tax=Roseovarius albus TaxID=1247867 RepID=A0A1X6ZL81_9RHOB|nr:ABC transporter ATP-binding protein [Roseovarius albus]SLN54853.1 Glutathione import ATP-binding protein GsiA [Roseovarius albus]